MKTRLCNLSRNLVTIIKMFLIKLGMTTGSYTNHQITKKKAKVNRPNIAK